jgi:alpha-1,2-mannosyltransferase
MVTQSRFAYLTVCEMCRKQLLALKQASVLAERTAGCPGWHTVKVFMVGGCRNASDHSRLADLQALAAALGLTDTVSFLPDAPFGEMRKVLAKSIGGLHSMEDEHFGISIVEYMAAGCVPIAHDSGSQPAPCTMHTSCCRWWID